MDGQRDVLGHWVGDGAEGANFWLKVWSPIYKGREERDGYLYRLYR